MERVELLIVDDEPMIIMSMEDFFTEAGFHVITADSAELGLEIVRRQTVHVVIVDYRLPGMDGEVMIGELKALKPDLVIFIHSGSHEYELSPRLLELGLQADHVVNKPADLFAFAKKIRAALPSRLS